MACVPLFISTLTAAVIMAVSPFASEMSSGQRTQTASAEELAPALGANMLDMEMCGARDQVLAELAQQFHEKPMAVGQVDANAVVEILVSESGSWTILATDTDGQSCIVSAGEGFESTTLVRGIDA